MQKVANRVALDGKICMMLQLQK